MSWQGGSRYHHRGTRTPNSVPGEQRGVPAPSWGGAVRELRRAGDTHEAAAGSRSGARPANCGMAGLIDDQCKAWVGPICRVAGDPPSTCLRGSHSDGDGQGLGQQCGFRVQKLPPRDPLAHNVRV
jgi:hypothetical protein